MGGRAITALGISAALALGACGSGDDDVVTTTSVSTDSTSPTERTAPPNTRDDPRDTNPTLAPKFEVGVSANQTSGGAKFTVTNTGDVPLVSGSIAIEVPGATGGEVQGGESCGGGGDSVECNIDSFRPGEKIVIDVDIDSSDSSDDTTTTEELVATVTVFGELQNGESVSTPPRQVRVG